jgi:NADPH:quinone reductase-like Zn-dependent oxidoreductase
MQAARIHEYGHADQLNIENIPQPDLKPNEVLVRISAAGINPVDWKTREGYMAKVAPRKFPFTLGQDFCGAIVALGDNVGGVSEEEDVYGFANGTYAEYVAVSPEMFATKPAYVDDVTSAALPTPGLTALQLVTREVRPTRGQTVLIHGAAGSVGSIATQLCLAAGARVIATASSKDAEYLRSLGVTRVIDYKTERFEDDVRDVDAVIDLVGRDTIARSVGVLREGGILVATVGSIEPAEGKPIRAQRFLMQPNKADLIELARLVDEGTIKPRPVRTIRLSEARKAQEELEHGGAKEKLVIVFD